MSADLFKNWFFHDFVPNVKKYLTEKGLRLKAMLLIDSAPTHPAKDKMRSGDIFVKSFLLMDFPNPIIGPAFAWGFKTAIS